jgi:hypothetical protein
MEKCVGKSAKNSSETMKKTFKIAWCERERSLSEYLSQCGEPSSSDKHDTPTAQHKTKKTRPAHNRYKE